MIPSTCQRCGYVARTSDEQDAHVHFAYVVTYESYEVFAERRALESYRRSK